MSTDEVAASVDTQRVPGDSAPVPLRQLALAAGVDTAVVVVFAAVGRRNHDRADSISGLIETAGPFVLGLGLAWTLWRVWRRPTSVRIGLAVWLTTVVVGMSLRRVVFGDGTATAFVIVAAAFLALLVAWRLLAQLAVRTR
ncbi:MAG: DUF3054 domain-containing protein [Actinomycetota bacterium]